MGILLNAIIPLFCIILVGYLAEKFQVLGQNSFKILNEFVIKFPLPILIFSSIAGNHIKEIFNIPFMAAFSLSIFIPYAIVLWLSQKLKRESISTSAMRALTVSNPNSGYIGIPVLGVLFGEQGILIAAVASFLTVFPSITTILFCELSQHKEKKISKVFKHGAILFIKNPLMIATFLGVLCSYIEVPFPKFFTSFITLLGNVAGPCALFALGQMLVGQSITKNKKEIGLNTIIKLGVQPLLAFSLLLLFQTNHVWAKGGLILSGLPTAMALTIFASYYKTYLQEATATILITTLCSIGTLLFLIWLIPTGS